MARRARQIDYDRLISLNIPAGVKLSQITLDVLGEARDALMDAGSRNIEVRKTYAIFRITSLLEVMRPELPDYGILNGIKDTIEKIEL